VWIFIRIIAEILKSKQKIKAENLEKIFAENIGRRFFFVSLVPRSEIMRES
jgi:hypothetical protein